MARRFAVNKTWEGKVTTTPAYKVGFIINAMTGDIVLEIDAPYFNDPTPPCEPGKCLTLHEHEVVEVFLAAYPSDDDSAEYSPYLEVQIGPHGHYNLVFFLQEADFKNMDTSIELDRPPTARINKTTGRWTAEIAIPSFFLPEPACGDDLSVTWMMNSYAIHGIGENREYLSHSPVPGKSPNFHQLRYFVPLVLFETLETRMTIDRSQSMAAEKIRQSSMAAASMGLSAGGDLSSRLLADMHLMRGGGAVGGAAAVGGMGKGPAAYYEDDEDDASSVESDPVGKGVFKMTGGSPAGSSAGQSHGGVPPDGENLHEEVAKKIKQMNLNLEELEEKYSKHLQPTVKLLQKSRPEYSVMHALVTKRKGLSFKARMLVLTSKARLLYFDLQGVYKGSVPWTVMKPVSTHLVSSKKFQVKVADKSRTYHFTDPQGAERWITVIELFTTAQRAYLKNTMNKAI